MKTENNTNLNKNLITKNNKSLVLIKKRINFNCSNFSLPLSVFTKYPIFLTSLSNRIVKIKADYSINSHVTRKYNLCYDKSKAQRELFNKGGVYILFCRYNGLFYVGSALRFFTNKGRLNDYFMKGRLISSLAGTSTKISKKLAESILKYTISSFTLIIPEEFDSIKLTKKLVQEREQL
jgi:hypothetical protein